MSVLFSTPSASQICVSLSVCDHLWCLDHNFLTGAGSLSNILPEGIMYAWLKTRSKIWEATAVIICMSVHSVRAFLQPVLCDNFVVCLTGQSWRKIGNKILKLVLGRMTPICMYMRVLFLVTLVIRVCVSDLFHKLNCTKLYCWK